MCAVVRAIIGTILHSRRACFGQRSGPEKGHPTVKTGNDDVATGAGTAGENKRSAPVPQGTPLPGTDISPGVYHRELLKQVMPDDQYNPIIEFARRHPAVPLRPQNPPSTASTNQPPGDAAKKQ